MGWRRRGAVRGLLAVVCAASVWQWNAPSAHAYASYSGADLIINCESLDVCDAFLAGVFDAYAALVSWNTVAPSFCTPTATAETLWPVLRPELAASPAVAGVAGASIVIETLKRLYPCAAGVAAFSPPVTHSATEMALRCQYLPVCRAMVMGVLDTHRTLVDRATVPPVYCLPAVVGAEMAGPEQHAEQTDEFTLTVLTFIASRPEQLAYTGGSVVLVALAERYPCF